MPLELLWLMVFPVIELPCASSWILTPSEVLLNKLLSSILLPVASAPRITTPVDRL